MSLTKWLSGGTDEVARKLACGFSATYPASLEGMTNRKSTDLRDRAIVSLLSGAVAFQKEHRMGVLRKILFARAIQGELKGAGYSPVFIRQLMSEVLAKVAFANR